MDDSGLSASWARVATTSLFSSPSFYSQFICKDPVSKLGHIVSFQLM